MRLEPAELGALVLWCAPVGGGGDGGRGFAEPAAAASKATDEDDSGARVSTSVLLVEVASRDAVAHKD